MKTETTTATNLTGKTCDALTGDMYYRQPCGRAAKVERNGKCYCGIHDPKAKAARREAVAAKRDVQDAERDARNAAWRAELLLKAAPELTVARQAEITAIAEQLDERDLVIVNKVVGPMLDRLATLQAAYDAALIRAEQAERRVGELQGRVDTYSAKVAEVAAQRDAAHARITELEVDRDRLNHQLVAELQLNAAGKEERRGLYLRAHHAEADANELRDRVGVVSVALGRIAGQPCLVARDGGAVCQTGTELACDTCNARRALKVGA